MVQARAAEPRSEIAAEAERPWQESVGRISGRFRDDAWACSRFIRRGGVTCSYAQVKSGMGLGLPVRPYLSARIIADTRSQDGIP